MSQFPWETSTGASQIFQASTRIPSGPMAGRYNQREVNRSPRRTDPYQRQPRPPHSRNVDPLHDHPRGKREWEQFEERTVPTILPPRDKCREPIVAHPLSSAHSRLLPAGRSITLQVVDDHTNSQRMNVPRRADQGPSLLRPDPTAPPPNLFTRLDGRGDTRTYKKNPKTYVKSPRYDPVRHRFNANKEPFVNKVKEIKKFGIGYPDQLGETNNIASVFTTQVEKRLNEKIVPDAARGLSVYTHKRHDGVNFLDFKEFHQNGSYLNSKAYSHSRHFNLSGDAMKNSIHKNTGIDKNFTMHQMDHMKQALEDNAHFDGKDMDMGDLIPDGQTNTFKTDKGTVSDWAVSEDCPEWIVAQARRAGGESSILKRSNTFQPYEGQVNEMKLSSNGTTGTQSDWAVSGDAPSWITNNIVKYDKNAIITRPKKVYGVKSSFINENGQEICDSTVSGDAPSFMLDLNKRVNDKTIVQPLAYKQPWHNRESPRKMSGRHASSESTGKCNIIFV
jgi:hypothetical protein